MSSFNTDVKQAYTQMNSYSLYITEFWIAKLISILSHNSMKVRMLYMFKALEGRCK